MYKQPFRVLLPIAMLWLAASAQAQLLQSTISTQNNTNNQSASSQNRIDQVADETEDLLSTFRQVVSESDSLKIYNAQLQRLVDNQREGLASIESQLGELEATDRAVTPLMIDMVDTLGQIVENDVPFRQDRRRELVRTLKDALDDPDVTVSEKYRLILESYQAEINLGRTTFAEQGDLPTGEKVSFLRIGRTLLFYQSLDGETTGWFNPQSREFETLGSEYSIAVKDGIAIAQNRRAPDLVRLPVPAPARAQ